MPVGCWEGLNGSVVWRKPPLGGLEVTLCPSPPSSLEEDAVALACLPLGGKLLSARCGIGKMDSCEPWVEV